jgi:hypothetical protein
MEAPAAKQRVPPSPWPPSVRGHVSSFKQTNKRARASSTLPAGALPRLTSCHIRGAGAQARLAGARQSPITSKEKSPKYPLAESLDSTKASGATVGCHN